MYYEIYFIISSNISFFLFLSLYYIFFDCAVNCYIIIIQYDDFNPVIHFDSTIIIYIGKGGHNERTALYHPGK